MIISIWKVSFWATLGFKSMKTAYATIKGIEVMRALRKGQASSLGFSVSKHFLKGTPSTQVSICNSALKGNIHTYFNIL